MEETKVFKVDAADLRDRRPANSGRQRDKRWEIVAALQPGEAVEAWGKDGKGPGNGSYGRAKKHGYCPQYIQLRTLKDGRKVYYRPENS